MSFHIFGIRHHGPGSARSLRLALGELKPDAILVEGPPDAADVLPLLAHPEMKPPVALLVYDPDKLEHAVYYPFAEFSPEWQAIHFGLTQNIPVRFMDLPQAHQLALRDIEQTAKDKEPSQEPEQDKSPRQDPLRWLAEAAGYDDSERWWDHMIEQRRDSVDIFAAIQEAMTSLRTNIESSSEQSEDKRELYREAWMRQTMRAAEKEGFKNIAVVCGAWHAPALAVMPAAKADTALLKGLPKTKVQSTWVPWTYGRLAFSSGYGAGIESPGWYHHLWSAGVEHSDTSVASIRWLTRVAQLLRGEDLDASTASIIEAVRLAEALAAMRGRPVPGLPEMNQATQSILCFGGDTQLRLIRQKLIVGETLGGVPDEAPTVPLQRDLQREQKRLRLAPEATQRVLDLDLRKENDLERSRLLHRLLLLDIVWGRPERVTGKSGTFHEMWTLQWQPELSVSIIEVGIWGNTVSSAATARTLNKVNHSPDLSTLTALLDRVLLADLADAVDHVMTRLQSEAAIDRDVGDLMDALPSLGNVLRYGNVRQTDTSAVASVVDGFMVRICIGLPNAKPSLNDEAAAVMYERLLKVTSVVTLLQNDEHRTLWHEVMTTMADQRGLHGLLARCCRILLDTGSFTTEEAARRLSLALSTASEPPQAAAWIEGFLKGSGLLLLHDEALWNVLDDWVATLSAETFTALVPLLRRTFSTFAAPERRQMGERVKRSVESGGTVTVTSGRRGEAQIETIDEKRADAVLPLLAQLLGLDN